MSISLAYGVILVKEQFDDFIDHLRDNCSTEEDHEIKGIFNAIETFLDANCDKETNLKCLLVLQKLIKPIANPKNFSPDLTKSLITTLRKSIDILSDSDLEKFGFERGNVKKFAIGFFKLQSNFQRFNRDLQIEFLNFLVKLAECDPKGNWAFLKYQLYELCSHNDDRLDVINQNDGKIPYVYAITKYIRNPSHMVREAAITRFHEMKTSEKDVLNRLILSMEQVIFIWF